jgi:hypothetical protein
MLIPLAQSVEEDLVIDLYQVSQSMKKFGSPEYIERCQEF